MTIKGRSFTLKHNQLRTFRPKYYKIFTAHLSYSPPRFLLKLCNDRYCGKTSDGPIRWWENFDNVCIRLHIIPQRDVMV